MKTRLYKLDKNPQLFFESCELKYGVVQDGSIGILWLSADKVRSSGTLEVGLAQTLLPWAWVNLSSCCAFKKPGRIRSKLQSGDNIKTMGLMGHMTKLENKASHFRTSHDIISVWQCRPSLAPWLQTNILRVSPCARSSPRVFFGNSHAL